jgi:hypothetical protein
MRRFLLYVPCARGQSHAELFGAHRIFDVAVNDWTGSGEGAESAEWRFAVAGQKWPGIVQNLPRISAKYEFYGFFDDDLSISTSDINRLFEIGRRWRLELFQASLDPQSLHISHEFLARRDLVDAPRAVPFVENQMPIFSRAALTACRPTFSLSQSGWGLDVLWAMTLAGRRMAVIDACSAIHMQPFRSQHWRMSNDKTPCEELIEILLRFGLMTQFGHYFGFQVHPSGQDHSVNEPRLLSQGGSAPDEIATDHEHPDIR